MKFGFALLRQDNGLQTTDNGRAAAGIRKKHFTDFFESIPNVLYRADEARWADRPGMWMNHQTQILSFAQEHLDILDGKFIKGTW